MVRRAPERNCWRPAIVAPSSAWRLRLLGELCRQAVETLAQFRELGLLAVNRGGEVGLPGLRLAEGDAALRELAREARPAAAEDGPVQGLPLRLTLLEAARSSGLALQGAQVAFDLADDVVEAQEVRRRLLELHLGDLLARLVARDPGGFLDQPAAFLGLAREDEADLALLDHRVGADAQAGVHEQVLDLLEPHRLAVQAVLRLAAAEDAAGDGHPAVVTESAAGEARIGEKGERDLAHAEGLPLLGAVEDDVLHGVAAHRLGALLAEDPGDGVREVRFAAAVRTDDAGDSAGEQDVDRVDERLESRDIEAFELEHSRIPREGSEATRGDGGAQPVGVLYGKDS